VSKIILDHSGRKSFKKIEYCHKLPMQVDNGPFLDAFPEFIQEQKDNLYRVALHDIFYL